MYILVKPSKNSILRQLISNVYAKNAKIEPFVKNIHKMYTKHTKQLPVSVFFVNYSHLEVSHGVIRAKAVIIIRKQPITPVKSHFPASEHFFTEQVNTTMGTVTKVNDGVQ